jgi:adenylate kinase family enzyme
MPLLGPESPLAERPFRVLVAGTAGAGKTTLAAGIGAVLGVPHTEIDALFHGADWTPRPTFIEDVEALAAGPAWVTEWQYQQVRELLAARADLMVWLDPPKRTVMRQVTCRTIRRRLRRQVLWNGNVEPPFRTILADPEYIVRWAWTTHHRTTERMARLVRDRPSLRIVRLGGHRDAARWLEGPLRRSAGG